MLNGNTQTIQSRNPVGIAISAPRAWLRGRKAQEPAATPTEVERGVSVIPTTKVRQAFAKTWGWD